MRRGHVPITSMVGSLGAFGAQIEDAITRRLEYCNPGETIETTSGPSTGHAPAPTQKSPTTSVRMPRANAVRSPTLSLGMCVSGTQAASSAVSALCSPDPCGGRPFDGRHRADHCRRVLMSVRPHVREPSSSASPASPPKTARQFTAGRRRSALAGSARRLQERPARQHRRTPVRCRATGRFVRRAVGRGYRKRPDHTRGSTDRAGRQAKRALAQAHCALRRCDSYMALNSSTTRRRPGRSPSATGQCNGVEEKIAVCSAKLMLNRVIRVNISSAASRHRLASVSSPARPEVC